MNRIAKRLDPRLDEIALFHELTDAESLEFDHLNNELAEVESNMTLTGTTERCIDRREAEFGVASDSKKPIDQRRAVLIAKLRGQGTTTPEFIKNVALSFQYGEVDVVEDETPYTVRIVFESVLGVPPNMQDFINALEEVKPAHLAFEYVYKYNTWDMLEAFNKTWDDWADTGVTFDELMTFKEDATQETLVKFAETTIRKAVQKWAQK